MHGERTVNDFMLVTWAIIHPLKVETGSNPVGAARPTWPEGSGSIREPGRSGSTWYYNWLKLRTDLRPRTRELYMSLRKLHLLPKLGTFELSRITERRPGLVLGPDCRHRSRTGRQQPGATGFFVQSSTLP